MRVQQNGNGQIHWRTLCLMGALTILACTPKEIIQLESEEEISYEEQLANLD